MRRLRACEAVLDRFLDESVGLGDKRGVLLVQLPPSFHFEAPVASEFFRLLRERFAGLVACEPRHGSWFADNANDVLRAFQVARVAADPPPHERAARPGGWPDFAYYRLHGTPRIYYSAYDDETLAALARQLAPPRPPSAVWCIFDNTAAGAAIGNALRSSVSCSPSSRWMPREPVAAPYG